MEIMILVLVLIIFVAIILPIKRLIKTKSKEKRIHMMLCNLCVVLAIASYIFNFGFCRFFLVIFAVLHTILFISINSNSSKYIEKNSTIKKYKIISYISYLVSNFALPDYTDTSFRTRYVFFGLIDISEDVWGIAMNISIESLLISIIALVILGVESSIAKKAIKREKINENKEFTENEKEIKEELNSNQ